MIFNLFRKSDATDAAFDAYRAIVAQSRREIFYAQWGVPDTVTGRFDMISLHMALALRRLKRDPSESALGQAIVDIFFKDMDRSLRELGVTDLGVPNKIKKMGNMFYGLIGVLDAALDTGRTEEVSAVLLRNVKDLPATGATPLAEYLLAETRRLMDLPAARLFAGTGETA